MTDAQTKSLLAECKSLIESGDVAKVKEWVRTLREDYDWTSDEQGPPDWAWIYQKAYLHACLRKRVAIATWLEGLFSTLLDPMEQIAYRHTLNYGRVLLRK
jgi:hypothetical protein